MNKYLLNLISSIVSLSMVIILLVFVSLAWYSQNTKASVSGVSGVTAGADFSDINLTRYIATETTVDSVKTYSIGDEVTSSNVKSYDLIAEYSKIIYKISFNTTKTSYSLSMTNTLDRNYTLQVGSSTDIYYNYLSNVAIFNVLSESNSSLSVTDNNYSFNYSESSDTNRYTINILSNMTASTSNTIYLLFDYNSENINKLFSANLGKNGTVSFYEDIMFVLQ